MTLLALVSFLLAPASPAFELRDPSLVRVLDGNAIQCHESYERNRAAFFPELLSATAASAEQVELKLRLRFALCAVPGSEPGWQPRRPLDPIFLQDTDGFPVRLDFRQPELFLGAADYRELLVAGLPNEVAAELSLVVPLAKALSSADRRALAEGHPVKVRTALVYRAIGKSTGRQGETPLGYRFGGAYTLFFTLVP